jgi:small nuclear ribonucleoprotein (snRNP)-like protein
MLEEFIGQEVVVDLRSRFVCLGTLRRVDELHLELRHADLHDLRDTQTTRENYVQASHATGIKRNRKRVLVVRAEVVAVSRLADVAEDDGVPDPGPEDSLSPAAPAAPPRSAKSRRPRPAPRR